MYDELVRLLKDSAERFDYDGWVDTAILMSQAAEAIEERCKQVDKFAEEAARLYAKQPEWISVSERLPESGVPTLICGDGNVVEQGFFDDEYGYWYDLGGNRTFVHHWMPLPQAPEEETIS